MATTVRDYNPESVWSRRCVNHIIPVEEELIVCDCVCFVSAGACWFTHQLSLCWYMWTFYLRVMTVLLLPWFYFYVSYSSTAFDDGRFVDLSSGAMGQASVENATVYPSWSFAMGSCVNSYPAVTTHAMEQGQRPWSWLEFDKFL